MRNTFLNKSFCEYIITSKEITPQTITQELNITPDRSYTKGEEFSTKYSGTKGKRFHNLWVIKSESIVSEKEDISMHISFMKTLLSSKMDIVRKYLSDKRFQITFWIWIETEDGGIGIDLTETEISFINSISNRTHISFLTKDSLEIA